MRRRHHVKMLTYIHTCLLDPYNSEMKFYNFFLNLIAGILIIYHCPKRPIKVKY